MRSNKVIGGGKSESNKASELRKFGIYILFFSLFGISSLIPEESYQAQYISSIKSLISRQQDLLDDLRNNEIREPEVKDKILSEIHECRILLKKADFWIRYLEPTVYKKINGPLPVEWETEVFEKFERPYKREGAGLTLAEQYLDEDFISKDHLIRLIQESVLSSQVYLQDSITRFLKSHHHFFLANRLFLLNLAAIYTTGFECPNSDRVIPELRIMLSSVSKIYRNYNRNYPHYPLTQKLYRPIFKNADFCGKPR
jgi:cytochrome c peroxidase